MTLKITRWPATRRIDQCAGLDPAEISHKEKFVSLLGGFTGILGVLLVSRQFLGAESAILIVASMGASAVLLFAVPHGALSQPWALVGGHLVSALIGVTVARWLPDPLLAAPLAVGLAIGAMHYLRCIHPPGGATALAAVVGGAEIAELGYGFVAAPVLLNALVMLGVAVAFNLVFPWRRYPACLAPRPAPVRSYGPIEHADLVYALSQIDSFVDVSENDLLRIYEMATRRRHPQGTA